MARYALLQHLPPAHGVLTPQMSSALADAFLGDPTGALSEDLYQQVALLETESPEHLFRMTQSFDKPWTDHTPTLWRAQRLRPTAIGDFLVAEGAVLLCTDDGWVPQDGAIANIVRALTIYQ